MEKHKLKCSKCGKKADKFGHFVEDIERGIVAYYHWNCYNKKYNNFIDALVKDARKKL